MIQLLRNKSIDKTKWDACIQKSKTPRIQALSWYLDIVTPGWHALIYNNYEAVMPLPVKTKWGIPYLIQPVYIQQMGIFGEFNDTLANDFLKAIPNKFVLHSFSLNEENLSAFRNFTLLSNYKLDINKDYNNLHKAYNRNCKRKLKTALSYNLTADNNYNIPDFLNFFKKNVGDTIEQMQSHHYIILEKLLIELKNQGAGEIVNIRCENELVAVGLYLLQENELVFHICASNTTGKTQQAMTFLVDSQIRKYAGKKNWYDFTGSNIPGIAYFNSTFGAKEYKYPFYKGGLLSKLKK